MADLSVLRLEARDVASRAAWLLPHDVRRSLYLRANPERVKLYHAMRNHEVGEPGRPKLGLSIKAAEELGCIFIHIPKNGGTSIGRSLFGDFEGNHMPIGTYQLIYDRETFERLFKFCVSRNPYDRLLSAYRFFRNGAERVPYAGVNDVSRRPELQDATSAFETFEQFVIEWLNPARLRQHEHFRPQYRFTCAPNGRQRVDYVGRFESMEESFAHIAERLGVDATLIHDRKSVRADDDVATYVDAYTPEMRKVVEDFYAKDLRLFDYHFGD